MSNGDDPRRGLLPTQQRMGGLMMGGQRNVNVNLRDERGPSLLDRILGMYGPDPTSHIPEEHQRGGIGAGLRGAGMAMLGASGATPGGFRQGLPQILGAGLVGAQQARGQYAEAIKRKGQQDKIQQMIQGGMGPEQLQAIMMELVGQGGEENLESAKVVGEALRTMSAAQAGLASKAKGQVVDKQMADGTWHSVLLDMSGGDIPEGERVLQDLGPVQPNAGVVVDRYNPEAGQTMKVLVDRFTGDDIKGVGSTAPKAPSQYSSEAESRLSQFGLARDNIVNGLQATGRGPTWAEWELYNSSLPGRKAISSDMQGLLQAQNLIVTQIAKELGGVRGAASKEFRNAIARTYLIAPGDQPKNIEQTLEALEAMERDLRRKAGMTDTEAEMTDDEIQDFIESSGTGAGEDLFGDID